MISPERNNFRRVVSGAIIAGLAFSACSSGEDGPTAETTVITVEDGCETFGVYAQNRFEPYGTAIREEPNVLSDKLGSFAPNEVIAVDGWYDSEVPTYPTNVEPWDSGVWFRLDYDNQEGWVSFPGVRAAPSSPDGSSDTSLYGGEPVLLTPDCQLFVD